MGWKPLQQDTMDLLLSEREKNRALESRIAEAEKQNGLLWSKGDYWEGVAKDAQEERDRAEKTLAEVEGERDALRDAAREGTLPRYGIRWRGPAEPISEPMPDGFWTPWHIATARLARIETAAGEAARWLDAAGMDHAARTLRTALALPGAEGREGEKDA